MHERSVNVSKKRVMISKLKCRVLLKRKGLDFKKSWKIKIAKCRMIKNQLLKVASKIFLVIRL